MDVWGNIFVFLYFYAKILIVVYVTGEGLENGSIISSNSKFDTKIEASSAKMYFHYYGQLLHQQNMLQDFVRTGILLPKALSWFYSDPQNVMAIHILHTYWQGSAHSLPSGTYYAAVMENRSDFEGRVVVDVGAGSGILSLFAAQVHFKLPLPLLLVTSVLDTVIWLDR